MLFGGEPEIRKRIGDTMIVGGTTGIAHRESHARRHPKTAETTIPTDPAGVRQPVLPRPGMNSSRQL